MDGGVSGALARPVQSAELITGDFNIGNSRIALVTERHGRQRANVLKEDECAHDHQERREHVLRITAGRWAFADCPVFPIRRSQSALEGFATAGEILCNW